MTANDATASLPGLRAFNWDKPTAIMAVMIGALALAVSWYTASLQNKQVKAQTWPYLRIWNSQSISNRGIGPAQIRDVKLTVDGKEVASFVNVGACPVGKPGLFRRGANGRRQPTA